MNLFFTEIILLIQRFFLSDDMRSNSLYDYDALFNDDDAVGALAGAAELQVFIVQSYTVHDMSCSDRQAAGLHITH